MGTQAEVAVARIRVWLIKAYIKDLQAFYSGDVNRFGRMVDGKGGSLGSVENWVAYIAALLQDELVTTHTPALELLQLKEQSAAINNQRRMSK